MQPRKGLGTRLICSHVYPVRKVNLNLGHRCGSDAVNRISLLSKRHLYGNHEVIFSVEEHDSHACGEVDQYKIRIALSCCSRKLQIIGEPIAPTEDNPLLVLLYSCHMILFTYKNIKLFEVPIQSTDCIGFLISIGTFLLGLFWP